MDERPIGIFDSGIGGLTVLKELIHALPCEDTIYLGDTARVPYGTKSAGTVTGYSIENAEFLLKHGVKLLVVACNTASAYAIGELRSRLDLPVIGVIEPGAKAAVEASRAKRIGVIGTEGTIKSGAYFDAIKEIDPKVVVFTRACPLFVPLAEEGWTENEVARLAAGIYLNRLKDEAVDVVLLGCTHYPLLERTIRGVMGEEVKLIDSATATAAEARRVLEEEGLLSARGRPGTRRFFVTDSPERFTTVGRRFLDDGPMDAELVRVGS